MTPYVTQRGLSAHERHEPFDFNQCLFHGRIVALNSGSLDLFVECDRNKPLTSAVDNIAALHPSLIDPLDYRPTRPILSPEYRQRQEAGHTTLSVFLYPENIPLELEVNSSYLQLNRDAREPIARTLKRLQIALEKRVRSGCINVKQIQRRCAHSIWKSESENGSKMFEWDCLEQSNVDVWNEACRSLLIARIFMSSLNEIWNFLVEANPPTIVGVKIFGELRANIFCKVPVLVSTTTQFANHVRVDWFCNGSLVLQNSPCFIPELQHIGKELAVLLTPISDDHDGRGRQEAYKFENKIEALPNNLIVSMRPKWTSPRVPGEGFIRTMTWNVLADQNAFEAPDKPNPGFALHVEPDVLCKLRRAPLCLHEILSYHPDVICLQEVDECVFLDLLQPSLVHFHYQGFFTRKASAGNREGCAMFWSLQCFDETADMRSYNLRDIIPNDPKGDEVYDEDWTESTAKIVELLQKRQELDVILRKHLGHVVQFCSLRVKSTGQRMIVCNTHLFYHEKASHVRIIQLFSILRKLHLILQEKDEHTAIVLCGDLNSCLERGAGRLLLERTVDGDSDDIKNHLNTFRWEKKDGDEKKESCEYSNDFPTLSLPESFPVLKSAPSHTPKFTNFVVGSNESPDNIFSDALDHILIGGFPKVTCPGNAPMPSARVVSQETAMPSPHLPSDHVSIVVDLKINPL